MMSRNSCGGRCKHLFKCQIWTKDNPPELMKDKYNLCLNPKNKQRMQHECVTPLGAGGKCPHYERSLV